MTDEPTPPVPKENAASKPESVTFSYKDDHVMPTENTESSKHKKIYLFLALVPILLALIAYGLWKSYQPGQIELQGRVEAETVQVATKIPSRIEAIYVHEGDSVKKGQALVKLHSPEIEAKKQQAMAALQSALALQSTAQRGSQEENVASLYANWQALKAQEQLAQTSYKRGANLFKEGVISRQRRDEMYAAAQSASQMTEAAYQQYQRAMRGSTPQQQSSADAQVDIAKAAVAEANALAAETELFAPIDATVSKTYGNPSELVATAVPVVSLISQQRWVSLNIREDQYAALQENKVLEGFIPALNKSIKFQVQSVSAEGEFATIKTTRQTGGYDVRSFKVHLVPVNALPELKVGMSVLFKLDVPAS